MEIQIEQIISDFYERDLPTVLPREVKLPQIPGKIDTIIGMRRSGKTYFLYQTMQDLLKQGVPKEQMLYINFDDERFLPLLPQQLHRVVDSYYRLFPEFKQKKCYFFFDEIQNINGWERFIRRILDTENVQIFLTGSSATLLSKEIASTLRGRSIATEIFPFSFRETVLYENPRIKFSTRPGAKTRAWMVNRFRQYLLKGGFPEVQTLDEEYRIRILQEYADIVILKDVIERYSTTNIQAIRAMARYFLATPATLFSVNKFYNDLRSQGISCTKNDLYDYLDYFHDAYLVYPVSIFSRSERVRRTNPRKIYLIDTGLLNAFTHEPRSDWGHLLENFVYMELRRQGLKVEYHRNAQENNEIDFVTTALRGEKNIYQVALNINEATTREREIRGLEAAMKEYDLKIGRLITLDHHETLKVKGGVIEVLPAWYWVTTQCEHKKQHPRLAHDSN